LFHPYLCDSVQVDPLLSPVPQVLIALFHESAQRAVSSATLPALPKPLATASVIYPLRFFQFSTTTPSHQTNPQCRLSSLFCPLTDQMFVCRTPMLVLPQWNR
jgi:hypothetical protein